MKTKAFIFTLLLLAHSAAYAQVAGRAGRVALILRSDELDARSGRRDRSLLLDGFFYETKVGGHVPLPAELTARSLSSGEAMGEAKMADGRTVKLRVERKDDDFLIRLSAAPDTDIIRWGLSIEAANDEYYTGLMERVVDGPQAASWAPGLQAAMDLRGQQVEMILKPTTSVYAPFYLSSRGYAAFVRSDWPGRFDFAATDPGRVRIEFEGPTLEVKIYTARDPAQLVRAHALETGPPLLPPRWIYIPWRWRDEHTHRATYYDGTPVTGPFNSEVMEDILMMKAFGIPCGVYWIDRPWGTGLWGYDDFEIDPKRLPNFPLMVRWLESQGIRTVLWIGPFFQGRMAEEALAKGYNLPDQKRPPNGNNYPLVDFTNPRARAFWQSGVEKLLRLGVAGFKLDRGEEDIPDDGPSHTFDGRSIRQNRNIYPVLYLKATHDATHKYRGDDFVLMPRAAYTGSAPYGVFWGGDIGGTQEGLRASIIAVQRAAVMGYPNWGSDTCGYNQQLLEQEVCGRWLAFSAFTPIMEVGPTRNVGFWNLPRQPSYDATLIAIWRLYARLHQKLADYSYACAREAHETGMPIVRPLFLVDPQAPEAWSNWWTYLYGPDILVSPIWEKGRRTQEVYLPRGAKWRDAWRPERVYEGGQTIRVDALTHQIPLFIRVGAKLDLGDLEREYRMSLAIAERRPDLKALETEVNAWFARANEK